MMGCSKIGFWTLTNSFFGGRVDWFLWTVKILTKKVFIMVDSETMLFNFHVKSLQLWSLFRLAQLAKFQLSFR